MYDIIILAIPAILIVVVFIFLVWYVWKINKEKKAGFAVKDERTVRIEGKAALMTFFISIYFMLALLYYVFATEVLELGLPILETGWALIISLLVTIGTFAILRWYYGSKADRP
ncbi:hypothetical protein CUJ83_08575 [Methanocella sp. CWC-04]|uniref:Uncharacterized protein n=1 Tax=Methanooceanicella nereidis TaxID=2052831 RepID=A0AAP2W530_9EURY|nr:DUF2178 domain-containing protein [Methanocella sp. CWC-04]MCD1295050.1 hypothetical protein [Methanocella sp. CWC-04]